MLRSCATTSRVCASHPRAVAPRISAHSARLLRRVHVSAQPASAENYRSCGISGWCHDDGVESETEMQAGREDRSGAGSGVATQMQKLAQESSRAAASMELAGDALEALQDALHAGLIDREDTSVNRLPPVFANLVKRLHGDITDNNGTLPSFDDLQESVLHWEEWTLPDAPLRDHRHLRQAAEVLVKLLGSTSGSISGSLSLSSLEDTEVKSLAAAYLHAATPTPAAAAAAAAREPDQQQKDREALAAAVAAAADAATACRRVLAGLVDADPDVHKVAAAAATTPLDTLLKKVVSLLQRPAAPGSEANLSAARSTLGAIINIKVPSAPDVLGAVNMDALVKHVFDPNAGVDLPRELRSVLRIAAGLPAVHAEAGQDEGAVQADPAAVALQLGQRLVKGLWGYGRLPAATAVHARCLPDDPAGKTYLLSKDRTAWAEPAGQLAAVWAPQAAQLLSGCQASFVQQIMPATASEDEALPAHLALAVVKGLDAHPASSEVRDALFHAAYDSGLLNDVDAAAWAHQLLRQLSTPLSVAATCSLLDKVADKVSARAGVPGAWSKLPLGCDPMEFTHNNDNLPTSIRAWFLRQLAQQAADWGAPLTAANMLIRVISAADDMLLEEVGRKEWGPHEPVGFHTVKDAAQLLHGVTADPASAKGDPMLARLYQMLPAAVQLLRVHQVPAPELVNAAVNSWRLAALTAAANATEVDAIAPGEGGVGPCPTAVLAQLLEDTLAHDAALAEDVEGSARRRAPYLPDILEEIFLWVPGPEQRLALFHQLAPGLSPCLRKEVLRVIRPLLGSRCYELAEPLVMEAVAQQVMDRAAANAAAAAEGEGKGPAHEGKKAVRAGSKRK